MKRLLAVLMGLGLVLSIYNTGLAQEGEPSVIFTAMPKNLQIYPRDLSTNSAVVPIEGRVVTAAQDEVILKVYRDDVLIATLNQPLSYAADGAPFAFAPEIAAGLINYDFEIYVKDGATETFIDGAEFVAAGDVYLINGQSNAMANRQSGSARANPLMNQFVRSFGRRDYKVNEVLADLDWHLAEGDGYWGPGYVGQWGLKFGRQLMDAYQIPIAILNGAHGGHANAFYARNDSDPDDINTNYGRLLWRAQQAGVADGVRAMLWYQGEADGGNPVGHENGMIALYHDWKEDYPNLAKVYIFQIRNSTCGVHSIDLRDRQRRLADQFPEIEVMSTTGLDGHDGCHYAYTDGYEQMGINLSGMVARDLYPSANPQNVDPPNVASAYLSHNTEITLVMRDPDDTLIWNAGAEADFVVEGTAATVTSGSVAGNQIRLALSGDGSSATYVSYIGHPSAGPWVTNANGVGLLAFRVPLSSTANVPPSINITSPAEGAIFTAGSDVTIAVDAEDSDGSVVQVDFYRNAAFLGTVQTAPWQFTWTNASAGGHTITAVATDDGGAVATSTAVNISVVAPPNQPPTVGVTQPSAGETFTQGEDILIEASAADGDGNVARVEFYAGSTLLGTDTAAPWQWVWTEAPTGTHALTAVATDDAGASVTSAAVTITVVPLASGEVTLGIQPEVKTITPSERFTVAVQVQAQTQPVSGAAAYVNFDPSVLAVVEIIPGNVLTTDLQNQYDNSLGTIDVAAGADLAAESYPTGTFTLATITFDANAGPTAPNTMLTFSSTAPRQSDVTVDDRSVLSSTQAGTIVFDGAEVMGSVTLQRESISQAKPHPSWQVPLSVRLYTPGEATPAYTFTPMADTSGTFHLYGIAPGDYEIAIKQAHALQNVQTAALAAGSNTIDFGVLREGDADDSNAINMVDFSILASAFGQCEGMQDFDPRADFNEDGCVTLFDFSLLSMNYTEQGDPDPGSVEARMVSVPLYPDHIGEIGVVEMALQPAAHTVHTGQQFEIAVQVQAGSQGVDAAGAFLSFDPSVLQVVDITPSALLSTTLRSVFDNDAGTIRYEAGKLGGPFPTGTFTLATVRFEAVASITETHLTFSLESPRQSGAYRAGINHLHSVHDGLIHVEAEAVPALYLPAIQKE